MADPTIANPSVEEKVKTPRRRSTVPKKVPVPPRADGNKSEFVTVIYIPQRDRYLVHLGSEIQPMGSLVLKGAFDTKQRLFDSLTIEPGVNQDIPVSDWDRFKNSPAVRSRLNNVLVVVPQINRSLDDLYRTYEESDAKIVVENCGDLQRLNGWRSNCLSEYMTAIIDRQIDDVTYRGL